MGRVTVFVLSLILLSGCAPDNLTFDPEVAQYVTDFRRIVNEVEDYYDYDNFDHRGWEGMIRFVDLPNEKWVGRCSYYEPWLIEIQMRTWVYYKSPARRTLIYHELGHCVLGLGHAPKLGEFMSAGIPYFTTDAIVDQMTGNYLIGVYR